MKIIRIKFVFQTNLAYICYEDNVKLNLICNMERKYFLNALTPSEEDVMRAFWAIGKGEINDAIKLMTNGDLPYTTIASTVYKLEKKNYLKRVGKKRGHIFAPVISEQDYARRTVKYVVSNFFTGSYKNLVHFFTEEQDLSKAEIEEILDIIENNE